MPLYQTRRVITSKYHCSTAACCLNALQVLIVQYQGHDEAGKAVFLSDSILTSLNPMTGQRPEGSSAGITNICKTDGVPPKVNSAFVDYYGKLIPLVDASGIYCRVCHFNPVADPDQDNLNIVHRTQSIDFGVVLEGEIQLSLDDGAKKILRKGDVVVQQGTLHVR